MKTNNSLLSTSPSQLCTEQSSKSSILSSSYQHHYIAPKTSDFLEKEKYLSEFNTDNKKFKARQNLGINGLAYWGNIQGYIEDQQDLHQFLQEQIKTPLENQFVTIQTTITEQIQQLQDNINNEIKSTLKTKIGVELGEEYEQGKASIQLKHGLEEFDNLNSYKLGCEGFEELFNSVLNPEGREDVSVSSINDVLKLLVNKVFPIEWKNWTLSVTDKITKNYPYEKGTTWTIPNEYMGDIKIIASPGNRGDKAIINVTGTNFEPVESDEKIEKSIPVYTRDVTGEDYSGTDNKTYKKEYTCTMLDNGEQTIKTSSAIINVQSFQYYCYLSSETAITTTEFYGNKIENYQSKNTQYTFRLGSDKRFLYILSPKYPTTVETAAGVTENAATSYSVLSGLTIKTVDYYPKDGIKKQTYYLINLGKQSNYVKVRIK